MAERRGLLRGKYLSPVQLRALEILNFLDEIEKIEGKFLQFRLALVSSGQYDAEKLFPEYSTIMGGKSKSVEMDDPLADSPDVEYDYTNVEWKGSEAVKEYQDIMSRISELQTGSIKGDQVVTYPGQGEWR